MWRPGSDSGLCPAAASTQPTDPQESPTGRGLPGLQLWAARDSRSLFSCPHLADVKAKGQKVADCSGLCDSERVSQQLSPLALPPGKGKARLRVWEGEGMSPEEVGALPPEPPQPAQRPWDEGSGAQRQARRCPGAGQPHAEDTATAHAAGPVLPRFCALPASTCHPSPACPWATPPPATHACSPSPSSLHALGGRCARDRGWQPVPSPQPDLPPFLGRRQERQEDAQTEESEPVLQDDGADQTVEGGVGAGGRDGGCNRGEMGCVCV